MINPFKNKRGLGRGLSSLIGDSDVKMSKNKISISSIVPNKNQPRKLFEKEALEELTNSIKERGIIQPLIVRKLDEIFLNYSSYKEKMNSYPNNSDIMCKNYMDLFENLIEEKNDLMKNRKTPNLINLFEKLIYLNSRRLKKFINKSD